MSVSLGSAHGDIVIDASSVGKTIGDVVAQFSKLDGAADKLDASIAKTADDIADAGDQMGDALTKGAHQAADAVEKADKAIDSASKSTKSFSEATKGAGAAFDQLANSAAVAGAAIVAGFGAAVKQASDLQTSVAKISTIRPDINFTQVGNDIQAMSQRVAQSTEQLAASLYNVFSSVDVSQAEALKLTEGFAKGAVAAQTDAETFGTAILGVMNAYKLSVSDAGHVSDVFFNTINKGVIDGGQLASVLGNVAQSAKNAGVNFDTLGALIAGITKEGGDAATNVNNLNNVLQKLVTEDVQKSLNGMGIATKDAAGNFRDVLDVLTDLNTALSALSQSDRAAALQKLFPDAQARTGIQTLLSQLDFVKSVAKDNTTAVNTAADAYAKMGQTAAAQAQILKNTLLNTLADLGQIALPNLVKVAGEVQKLVEAFQGLPQSAQSSLVHIAALSAAILLVGAGVVKAVSSIVSLVGALGTILGAARAATTALTAFAAAQVAASGGGALGLVGLLSSVAVASAVFVGAILAANKAVSALTGESLPAAIKSLVLYGDAWGKAHEAANTFAQANKGDLKALTGSIDDATAKIKDLDKQIRAIHDISLGEQFQNFLDHPFSDGGLRQLEVQKKNLEVYAADLQKIADEQALAIAQAEDLENRRRAMVSSNFIGPVAPFIGPVLDPSTAAQTNEAAAALSAATAAAIKNRDATIQLSEANATLLTRFHETEQTTLANKLTEIASAMSKVQGATSPLSAALDILATKQAQHIPLTAQESALYQQIPGYLSQASAAYQALALAQAQTAIKSIDANGGIAGLAGGFGGAAAGADGLAGALNRVVGQIIALNSAQTALSAEDAKLTGFFNQFKARSDALLALKESQGGKLNAADTAELAHLLDLENQIGKQLGDNAAKERENAEALYLRGEAAKKTAAAIATVTAAVEKQADATAAAAAKAFTPAPTPSTQFAGAVKEVFGPVNVPVTPVPGVGAGAAALAGALGAPPGGAPIPIPVTVSPQLQMQGFDSATAEALGIIGGKATPATQQVTINATDNATAVIAAVQQKATALAQTAINTIIGATDNASGLANSATVAIKAIPEIHSTELNVVDNATGTVATLIDLINSVPSTLNVTAHVDTSGALAAIQELRNNMPSSPAKEGPFRKLPDWSSVMATLEPAMLNAVDVTTTGVDRLSSVLDEGLSRATDDTVTQAKSITDALAQTVQGGVDALAALSQVQGVSGAQLQTFANGLHDLVQVLHDLALEFGTDGTTSAKDFSADAKTMIDLVVPAVEAFRALQRVVQPTADQIGAFAAGVGNIVTVIAQVAARFDQKALDAAAAFADAASKAIGLIAPAVEAFAVLPKILEPTADQIGVFMAGVGNITLAIVQASRNVAGTMLPHATAFADLAAKSIGLIIPAVEAFDKLRAIVEPTADQIGVFMAGVGNIAIAVSLASRNVGDDILPHATAFADYALKAIGLIAPAVEGFVKLKEVIEPTADQIGVFMAGITNVALAVAHAASLMADETIAHATTFADYAAKAIGLVGQGVEGLAKLAADDFRLPDEGRLIAFADIVAKLTQAIANAASTMQVEAAAAAGTFSDQAAKVVGLLGGGVEGFTKLVDFTPPTDAAIASFVASVINVVHRVADASKTIEAEAVKAAATFSEGAGKAVALIGQAINALTIDTALDKEGKPTKSTRTITPGEIDALVFIVGYAVSKLIDLSRGFDTGALTRMVALADAAQAGLGALKSIMDTINAAGKEDKPKEGDAQSLTPAQAIDKLIGLFSEGLTRLANLATIAQQYRSVAFGIRDVMAEAAAALSAALGGMPIGTGMTSQALALATNNGQFVVRAEVRHTFDPLQLTIMGENGPWIVRSLQLDGQSRTQVAGMIADTIMGADAGTPPTA